MKTMRLETGLIGWVCAALLVGIGAARAQDEGGATTGETAVVTTEEAAPVVEPATETAPATTEPAKSVKAPPARKGEELTDAFKGAGSSLYGVKGRAIKMPAKKSVKREKGAWRREIELGATTSQGNKDSLRYVGSIEVSKETDVNFISLLAAGRYGETDNERDAENATGEAKFQHCLTERWYVAADGNIYHDQIADLAYRARGNLSLGRYFIRSDRTILATEAGPGYVAERKGGVDDGFLAGRLAEHLEFLITSSLQVWQAVEYIPSFEDSRVYFVNAEAGLETVLVPDLSLVCTIEDRYDSNPAEDKENNDLLTTTALKWKF